MLSVSTGLSVVNVVNIGVVSVVFIVVVNVMTVGVVNVVFVDRGEYCVWLLW